MLRTLATATVSALALVATLGIQPATAASPGDQGPDPYWPLDGNAGIDVLSYTIDNDWSFERQRLSGSTVVELTATQDLSAFSLDFLLPVSKVSIDGVAAKFSRGGRGHELRIKPSAPLTAGSTHSVKVRYAGKPGDYKYAGENAWLASDVEVVAMGEPHMAPWWFPSNDHPTDKALVDVSVTVPKGQEAIANGRLVSRRTAKGETTWRWRADEPMTTYLAFFAAGDFTIRSGNDAGRPWWSAVSRSMPKRDQRASMRMLMRTPQLVRTLEEELGPYPFSTTGGLVTSLWTGFALENQTRPTYPRLSGGDEWLLIHELAHQWFGDHVAVQRWSDIWLNEGFATFMEWRHEERKGGESAQDALRSRYDNLPARNGWWKIRIGDPGAKKIFDSAVYERGGMTLQALRNRIGDESFFALLRAWAQRPDTSNATTQEFEALAASMSGQDLTGFFEAWLRTPTKPAATAANGLA